MSKITLNNVANLENETTAVNVINTNSATITTAFDNTLSRDGTSPNTMAANLDMNSNRILNLPAPNSSAEPVRFGDLSTTGIQYSAGTNISIGGTVISTITTPTFTTVNGTPIPASSVLPARSGTPSTGQTAQWASSTTLKGVGPVTAASVTTSNPTGTSGTVMMGLGASCTVTPVYSTRVLVTFTSIASNSSGTGSAIVTIKYGTGTAPSNGAASTGTTAGTSKSFQSINANAPGIVSNTVVITGLTAGTAYWFDLLLQAGGGTATITNIDFSAVEI